jgi:hypothetical protein
MKLSEELDEIERSAKAKVGGECRATELRLISALKQVLALCGNPGYRLQAQPNYLAISPQEIREAVDHEQ